MSAAWLRPLGADDLPWVAALAARTLRPAWSEAMLAEEHARPGALGFGLHGAAAPIGFALGLVVLDELEIFLVAVEPNARRLGHARSLVHALLAEAAARGACQALLEVRAGNAAAIALYGALGFTNLDVRRRYYDDGEDALVMARARLPEVT